MKLTLDVYANIPEILADIRELSDDSLHGLAVQVRVWMLCAEGQPWSRTRMILVRLLSRVGDAFGERGWSVGYNGRGNYPPGSRWARVHDEANRRVAESMPHCNVARELAAWLRRRPVAA